MIHSARRSVWLGRVALPGQPGGLGVPSSNLGAPTRLSPNYQCFSQVAAAVVVCEMRTERRQSAPTRTNNPEKVPNSVPQEFTRDSNGREKPFSCDPSNVMSPRRCCIRRGLEVLCSSDERAQFTGAT